ncbi:serine/threonine protein kinase [Oxynema aestuarii]|uniref:Serine/threonine protein kinase n=1 Tax=Oxynema aestuarii AP17 TaxID=2064643 RepID=A0A6H1TWG9_9CYAN|nr:serine/threonine-protein kinase [Oxynema aestuarii]QIZ70546.1 serine/threonine protein kinase [Oxynema aestuarii AP17]
MLEPDRLLHERYQLQHRLSENQVRQTWLAKDLQAPPDSDDRVVLKLLPFGGEVQWEHLKLFEREAHILQQLQHPRIPRYRDYFHIDDRSLWFALVQEYIPANSLKQWQENGKRFDERDVRRIARELLDILIYLHHLNPPVLHRDLKPSNLLVDDSWQVYLVDFGAVQDKSAIEGSTFTVVGTYGYAPMEQFGGRTVPASDLYALGATLIHLLSGIAPADLPQADLRFQFRDRISASEGLICWLEKMTEPSVERRFASAREAKEALDAPPRALATVPQQAIANTSGQGGIFDPNVPVPEEILGWNWGAFLMANWWPLTNRVWFGLLSWMPFPFGSIVNVLLGYKGNEWAWKSRRWRSIEQFKSHQRGWTIAGIFFAIPWYVLMWMILWWLLEEL